MDAPPSSSQAGDNEERISAVFRGTAGAYFRIWLVNSLLTIITVGFYSPWAKVRNKRYFYGNAWIGDSNFEYHANPLAILVARLVLLMLIGGGAIWAGQDIVHNAYYSLALLFFLPWAIVRGLSFNARNSSWAGMRFSFIRDYAPVYLICSPLLLYNGLGLYLLITVGQLPEIPQGDAPVPDEVKDFVMLSGILGACFALLMILLVPFLVRAYHRYKAERHKLGNLRFYLHNPSVAAYYQAILIPCFVVLFFAIIITIVLAGIPAVLQAQGREDAAEFAIFIVLLWMILSYLIAVWVIQAMLFRVFWNNLRARNDNFEARFVCDINIWHFAFGILFVNALATIVSLGLLHPWAKVRKTNYLVRHIHIIAPAGTLASLAAKDGKNESALGEELDVAEGFDFDVGLI